MVTGEVRFIDLDEAKARWERGAALFVDVRGARQYRQSHIPGAISMPLLELARRMEELPRDRAIITY